MNGPRLVVHLALGSALVVLADCSRPEVRNEPAKDSERTPDLVAEDVTQIVTRDGRKRAEIVSPRLLRYESERRSSLEGGITVRFFGAGGRLVSTLTCRRGAIDESVRTFTAIDSVRLVNLDATVLETDTLRWEEGSERVFGPGRVTIQRREGREVGVGFEAESDLSSWTLMEVVTTLVPADSVR